MLHGDEFDSVIKASPLLEALGSHSYAFVLRLNRYVNFLRRRFGFPYWSIAAYLKHKVKNAVRYIANFEQALADEAQAARRRWRDLRSYPSCGDRVDRRHALLQRRRLGRELHDAHGRFRGSVVAAALDGAEGSRRSLL